MKDHKPLKDIRVHELNKGVTTGELYIEPGSVIVDPFTLNTEESYFIEDKLQEILEEIESSETYSREEIIELVFSNDERSYEAALMYSPIGDTVALDTRDGSSFLIESGVFLVIHPEAIGLDISENPGFYNEHEVIEISLAPNSDSDRFLISLYDGTRTLQKEFWV